MTSRALWYAFTRPGTLALGVVGLVFLSRGATFLGAVCLGLAAYKAGRLLQFGDLDQRLRLKKEKQVAGVERPLSDSERREMLKIDAYTSSLRALGCNPQLVEATQSKSWDLLKHSQKDDASDALRRFRQTLPPIDVITGSQTGPTRRPDLSEQLQRELSVLHATRKELDSL